LVLPRRLARACELVDAPLEREAASPTVGRQILDLARAHEPPIDDKIRTV
jgi:hypothetical protein